MMIHKKFFYTFNFIRADFFDVIKFNNLSVAPRNVNKFVAIVLR